ncbi:MAG: glycoside hydrolase family 76 protein [Streptosporangiaceae bacterium]
MTERDFRACATSGAAALQRWYSRSTGLWRGTGWWNSANALTALIGYIRLTGDSSYAGVIGTTFTAAQRTHGRFLNSYYDDNAWWALAWIAAYDLTGEERYLAAARTIFTFNTGGWQAASGGGMVWHRKSGYKNAVTNELFLLLAAQLHQRLPGEGLPGEAAYLGWALKEWDWFSASGMIGPGGLVNDGLNAEGQNNRGPTWTYNQGVILGGLTALTEITGDQSCLQQAQAIADAALSQLASPAAANPAGILTEPCEAAGNCDGDQSQFKGIFIRHLYQLWLRSRTPAYRAFILANANSVWAHGTNAANQSGLRWTGPFDRPDPSRQSSALEALTAAAALSTP